MKRPELTLEGAAEAVGYIGLALLVLAEFLSNFDFFWRWRL